MACEQPIKAWRAANGGPLRFTRGMPVDGQAYYQIEVPCGTCLLCREEQARQWAVRIAHEASMHLDNAFVTLTYDDEHLPEHNSLDYTHLQKFWKRLRKRVGDVRYYAVGEYGDESLRPHYHACIFGHGFTEGRCYIRTTPTHLWTSPILSDLWGMGMVSVGALNYETARYTASYVTKKLRAKQKYVRIDEETGELIDLVQPRAFMSLKPAIALEWLANYGHQLSDHDRVVINGQPQKPPKFYDRWNEKVNGKEAIEAIKQRRAERAKASPKDMKARASLRRAMKSKKTI